MRGLGLHEADFRTKEGAGKGLRRSLYEIYGRIEKAD